MQVIRGPLLRHKHPLPPFLASWSEPLGCPDLILLTRTSIPSHCCPELSLSGGGWVQVCPTSPPGWKAEPPPLGLPAAGEAWPLSPVRLPSRGRWHLLSCLVPGAGHPLPHLGLSGGRSSAPSPRWRNQDGGDSGVVAGVGLALTCPPPHVLALSGGRGHGAAGPRAPSPYRLFPPASLARGGRERRLGPGQGGA